MSNIGAVYAQDSLSLKNNDQLVGEVKSMDRGVLTIETDYSKSDFKVEWDEVKWISTTSTFLVTLSDGSRLAGRIQMADSAKVSILTEDGPSNEHTFDEIVYMNSVNKGFWDQLSASISLGYSVTKAGNLRQFTSRSNIGYRTKRWVADASYNGLQSNQDNVEPIQRKDGGLTFNLFLPKDWYFPVSATFLSNTEQKIDLRLLGKVGIGKYLIHSNNAYWGVSVGVNGNVEYFSDDSPDKSSMEGFVGTELNLFDVGDLSLLTKVILYPSITESGRLRSDLSLDTKYDLPLDFYIQLGFTMNYDNRATEGAPSTDYVFQTTFGWKW
ncbi:MAG: DUF481 domain-containing protein [Cyclobacteriaceae bacterium]|nr:DUF481 domain-containing protein [Cyclobacteriaceae bacterium]